MRINSINYFENKTRTNKSQNYTTVVNRLNSNLSFRNIYNKDIFFSNIKSHKLSSSSLSPSTNKIKTVSFMGKTVHIVDGGAHADNMKHFASAINFNISVKMHDVETNPKDSNTKQLKSLEEQLKNLNGNPNLKGEYIAIPAVASVALLNLQDQYNRVMGTNKTLTPQNIKANKTSLIEFLEKIYKNPEIYSKSIKYMDDIGQGKEYTYGVIQEINKLIDKGAKVYIPAGHPHDTTLKWMAAQRGLKPELYHFIATGEDKDHLIQDMSNDIKSKNWYDFNLLALSNANVVGLKDVSGEKDYFFAAYDSCITDGARGVYNFSPIRNEENDKLEGYSYTNTLYAEYPFEKFPANDEVANLVKFVGKDAEKVIASEDETLDFLIALENNEDTDNYANKLYPVNEIFSKNEIIREKMALKGDYVDSSLKLFFRKNKDNKIIFPKCDCEGSGKPSVLSMWGSCFSVFNAISRDIRLENSFIYPIEEVSKIINSAEKSLQMGLLDNAEGELNHAIDVDKALSLRDPNRELTAKPFILLGDLHFKNGKYDYALGCYNKAIDILSKATIKRLDAEHRSLDSAKTHGEYYIAAEEAHKEYKKDMELYNSSSFIMKFLMGGKPPKPEGPYPEDKKYYQFTLDYLIPIAETFKKISKICEIKGEKFAAKICTLAAYSIEYAQFDTNAEDIVRRRAEGTQFIGDLFPTVKEDD